MNRQTKTIILIGVLIFHFSLTNAQNPDIKRTSHWYFGSGAGIDFSSGEAKADTSGQLHTIESCSTMSDTLGNVLFYTDGDTVWNRNHQPMPNGTGLLGCGNWDGSSSQGGIIVPHPMGDSLYYIFTSDCLENNGVSGFRYSVVNLKMNSGLGDIIQKNILLFAPSTEGIAATKHTNGKDFWVVTHEHNTDRFFAYLINENGIDTVPVISHGGTIFSSYYSILNFSFDGTKLGVFHYSTINELFRFNKSTGKLTDRIGFGYGAWGPWFSPDNSKIYLTVSSYVIQFCINTYDSSVIANSAVTVAYNPDNNTFAYISQPGVDGRLYVSAKWYASNGYIPGTVHVIQNPNNYGTSCNLEQYSFFLGGKEPSYGFPQFVSNFCYSESGVQGGCDSTVGISENNTDYEISVYPNPASDKLFINSASNSLKVQVVDLYGNKVKEKMLSYLHDHIDVSDIASGIYNINIQTKAFNSYYKQKILIIH